MRADRLLSILLFLETRGRTTTDRLAEEFEVSRRTILRDLYALRVAGFPVYTVRGPHGGCYLHEEYRNTLTHLTTEEAAALFLSSIDQPLQELGLSGPLRAAVLKLTAALPASRRAAQSRVTDRILLDSATWEADAEPVGSLGTIHHATMEDRWISVVFCRPFGVKTKRRIAPYGLVAKSGSWFVVWADEDRRVRADRVARVLSADIEAEGFVRPASFDLSEFWSAWRDRQVAQTPKLEVRLRVRKDALEYVTDLLGPRRGIFYGRPKASDEGVDLVVVFSFLDEARTKILSLGGAVEVLSPLPLRRSVIDFAEQIRHRYDSRSSSVDAASGRGQAADL